MSSHRFDVLISEVGPRDGLQSVASTMSTAHKLAWIAALVMWRAAELGEQIAPLEPRTFEFLTLVASGTGSDRHQREV